jgi:2-polyprenyl-6-methoxyphenol hydroxylase-like FAD-dependent oxidoreductase
MGMQDARILLVGAGIGGLSAALALQHFGHEVLLFEQAMQLNPPIPAPTRSIRASCIPMGLFIRPARK